MRDKLYGDPCAPFGTREMKGKGYPFGPRERNPLDNNWKVGNCRKRREGSLLMD